MVDKKTDKTFSDSKLSKEELENFRFVQNRILELQAARQVHYGTNLDALWADADRDYVPHRLKTKGKKVVATDEEKGWRGAMVQLGAADWQSDVSQSNPFTKISVALSILVDQNPSGVFTPRNRKYQATTSLHKQLYDRSWEYARSKEQLKLFIFNLAKYGWAVARTFPLRITRKVKVIDQYNQDEPDKTTYIEKEVVEFNDIMRENLDPRNCWMDDMARPNNAYSKRDWVWRKVYPMDSAEEMLGKYKNWKYVTAGGNTQETITGNQTASSKQPQDKNLVEVYFYENVIKDMFLVVANGVPVVIEPLPISDSSGVKKLSLWETYWNLRHAESPYGVGIYEAIRYDQGLLDRIRNMTIDQLTLSIYKMFFYQGTQALNETGDIKIVPGQGKQVLDPKNINWLQVPGPGKEAWEGLSVFKKDLDDSSGISDPLLGVVTGKTAFELAQAKEAALKRLKTPLDNICDALNTEGYITISLVDLLYSIPETYKITDQALIEQYLQEIQSDPDLYQRDDDGIFEAKVYPEFPLNLDKDEKGNLVETKETAFFRVKPRYLKWEGVINIKSQSLLVPSKQLDKTLELEMFNMLIPLFAQPPELYKKTAESIVKLYDKDPKDILPDAWLVPPQPQNQGLFVDQEQMMQEQQMQQQGMQPQQTSGGQAAKMPSMPTPQAGVASGAPKVTPSVSMPSQGSGIGKQMISRVGGGGTRM